MSSYTVRRGDTLTGIALAQKMCVKGPGNTLADWGDCLNVARHIGALNHLESIDRITPGQVLRLTDDSPDTRVEVLPPGPTKPDGFNPWWLGGIAAAIGGAWWFTRKDGGSFAGMDRKDAEKQKRLMAESVGHKYLSPEERRLKIIPGKDYGFDPIGDGTVRMVPSGDVVSIEVARKRLGR